MDPTRSACSYITQANPADAAQSMALAGDAPLRFKHDLQKKIIGAANELSVKDLIKFVNSPLFALVSYEKKRLVLRRQSKVLMKT